MSIEIKVPAFPESITDAVVAKWYKKVGENVEANENLLDLETDKVMLEVPAPQSGVLTNVLVAEGDTVTAAQVLAFLDDRAENLAATPQPSSSTTPPKDIPQPVAPSVRMGPAARRLASEKRGTADTPDLQTDIHTAPLPHAETQPQSIVGEPRPGTRSEKRVPMSRLRQRVAERLLDAQHQAAILTTFNEVNMQAVTDLRQRHKASFEKTYGIRLGLMSFFTKATVEALKRFPIINAAIDETDLIYHDYCDVGIAVGSPRGLVVPILRNAEHMGMATIEQKIRDYAEQAKAGKIAIEDITGGTFTITNGGVYGSMLSTPIINPPQSAILGLHRIVQRPIVENDVVLVRPVMYIALSYDHRLIDGQDAVQFLVAIKEMIEDPARLLLGI